MPFSLLLRHVRSRGSAHNIVKVLRMCECISHSGNQINRIENEPPRRGVSDYHFAYEIFKPEKAKRRAAQVVLQSGRAQQILNTNGEQQRR